MTARVKAHRKRMAAAGWKQSAIWLPPQAVERLAELAEAWDLPRQEVIARLIVAAESSQTPADNARSPVSGKKRSKKKRAIKAPATKAKKKAAVSKKKASKKKKVSRKRKIAAELDTVGLERPAGYEDHDAAVSIRIDRGVNNAVGEHVDWDWGMIRYSYMWDSEMELETFRKKHKKARIEANYPHDHKRSIIYRAHYPDGVKDHRIVLGALPVTKNRN